MKILEFLTCIFCGAYLHCLFNSQLLINYINLIHRLLHNRYQSLHNFARINLAELLCFFTVRKSSRPANLATADVILGTCPDMCPEKERYMREDRRRLSIFEIVPGTDLVRFFHCHLVFH
jgi:hypothetical protein